MLFNLQHAWKTKDETLTSYGHNQHNTSPVEPTLIPSYQPFHSHFLLHQTSLRITRQHFTSSFLLVWLKPERWRGGDFELGLSVYDDDRGGLKCWIWRKQEESNTSRSLASKNGGRRRIRRARNFGEGREKK